jgi:hypothetical protein
MDRARVTASAVVFLVGCSGIYAQPPPAPATSRGPSQEEIDARVTDILSRAKAVQRDAEEAVKLEGSAETARVFQQVRGCRRDRATCIAFEAQAEQRSKIGAQAGLADWLVDAFAGWSLEVARPRLFAELFSGGTAVVRGDGVVLGRAAPQTEPALVQAEGLVKEAMAVARPIADARTARKTENDACMAAAKDCDAQGSSYCQSKCDAGDATYCEVVGVNLWKSDPPRFGDAKTLMAKACNGGVQLACDSLPKIDADAVRIPNEAWATVQAVGDRLASNRFTLATVVRLRPTRANIRDVDTARAYEPKIIADEFCPARQAFVRLASPDEFRRRAVAHCKDSPPTAQGPAGAQVALPQDCASVFAIACPSIAPAAPAHPTATQAAPSPKPPTCIACPAGSHSEGKMGSPACWCTTGDPAKDAAMSSLSISPPSPSCRPAGACDQGCAFTCP